MQQGDESEKIMPIEVKYEPFKELVIKSYTYEANPEKLAELAAYAIAAGQPGYLQWAEGILFVPAAVDPETQYEELLQDKVVWLGVTFALMPEYQSMIRVHSIEVPVLDVSNGDVVLVGARWLKTKIPK